jgi:hypothetical protein
MTSWRASAPQSVQDDLDELLNVVLPFAEDQLGKHGEFFPFGAALSSTGETVLLGADPRLGDRPLSEDVLRALYEGARADSVDLRAAAFVADVLAGGSDAIRVEVEHRDGPALTVVLPYQRSRLRRRISFGQMSTSGSTPKVWGA